MADRRAPLSHCAGLVRQHDKERWLTLLYAHPDDREALAALYAFNHEVAKTRESVSEPMVGEIRLEWWRETIDQIYGGTVRRHPVAEALAAAIAVHSLPQDAFERMIAARREDLYDERPKTVTALVAYADNTAGELGALAARICGGDEIAIRAARAVGRGWALTGLVRALGFQARMGRLMLPDEALREAGIDPATIFRGDFPEEGRPVIAAIAAAARAAMEDARASRGRIAARARSPLLLAVLAEDYLMRLARASHDPFAADFRRGALARQWKLLLAALGGRW
ncbi:MAG: squalene/phytoene synthase family protein [Rhodothalassiaceae bacterium]